MEDIHTLYKLIVLNMLERAGYELTNSQISAFILEQQYTDYFTVQETLADMQRTGLLTAKTMHNTTYYAMTDIGRESLGYFQEDVSAGIQKDIERYFRQNGLRMRSENSVTADYSKTAEQEFTARLQVKEKETVLIELELTVPSERQAILLCDNWKKKNQQIYGYLMEQLLQDIWARKKTEAGTETAADADSGKE